MSSLLNQAVLEASKLSVEDQDAIATVILDEIEDDRRWEEAFERSPGTLDAPAARAVEQVRAGRCRDGGFDGS